MNSRAIMSLSIVVCSAAVLALASHLGCAAVGSGKAPSAVGAACSIGNRCGTGCGSSSGDCSKPVGVPAGLHVIGLTPAQRSKLALIDKKTQAGERRLRLRFFKTRDELARLTATSKSSVASIRRKAREQADIQAELCVLKVVAQREKRKVYTPGQKATLPRASSFPGCGGCGGGCGGTRSPSSPAGTRITGAHSDPNK